MKTNEQPAAALPEPAEPGTALDLSFSRIVDVPRHQIWRAWTEPDLLMQWFCPLPWKTTDCQIDLQPGGVFRTTMRSPDGGEFPNTGCYLQIIPNEKLVWTNALLQGFRPASPTLTYGDAQPSFNFTATVELADAGDCTHYTATVVHADERGCKQHAAMGFEQGWGIALDQLVAMVKKGL